MYAELGHILDKRYKETKNPDATSEQPGARVLGAKQGTDHAPYTHHHQRGWQATYTILLSQLLDTPLHLLHIRNKLHLARKQARELLTCSHSHCCSRNPNKVLPEFRLACSKFLLIGKVKKPGQYHEYNDENCLDLTDSEGSHEPSDHILRLSDLDFQLPNMTWSDSINPFLHVFLLARRRKFQTG